MMIMQSILYKQDKGIMTDLDWTVLTAGFGISGAEL
jgi:hypothetical protein